MYRSVASLFLRVIRLVGVARLATATAFATFCLLISGGLVSVMEAGMACGFDWPLCQGDYIPRMIDGKQYEHPHRLTAMFVGVMTFGLLALILKYRRSDGLLVRLGILATLLVVAQALLGRLTVKMALPVWVSSTHQATAMAFFCLVVSLAFITRQREGAGRFGELTETQRGALGRAILPVALLAFAQVVAGAVMRHNVGGLACGYDFPLCLGTVWPLGGHAGVQAHMVHRTLGVLLGLAVFWLAWRLRRLAPGQRAFQRLSLVLVVGVLAQITLGIATILTSRDLVVMTGHSSLGAAILAGLVSLYWMARPAPRFVPEPVSAPAVDPSMGLA
jgi:cytochrome c oxidase assembly protein subunit 15